MRDIEAVEGIPREILVAKISEPRMIEAFIGAMHRGLKRGDRTCVRIFAEAHKLVGTQHIQIAINTFLNELGTKTEEEARLLIESGRRMEALKNDASLSLEQYRNDAVDVLKVLLSKRPEWRAEVIRELGGSVNGVATSVNGS